MRFVIRIAVLLMILMPVTGLAESKCRNLCHQYWWDTASKVEIKREIARGININSHDHNGNTPLHHAAKRHRTVFVRLLIEADANVNAKNERGDIPLHIATRYGSSSTVRILIDAGSDINTKNTEGDTPLHFATWSSYGGGTSAVKMLIGAGADVNAQNNKGNTPLHRANNNTRYDLLVEAGADKNILNKKGDPPKDVRWDDGLNFLIQLIDFIIKFG